MCYLKCATFELDLCLFATDSFWGVLSPAVLCEVTSLQGKVGQSFGMSRKTLLVLRVWVLRVLDLAQGHISVTQNLRIGVFHFS